MNKRILYLTEEQKSQIEDFICYKEEQEVSKNTLIQYRKTLELCCWWWCFTDCIR